MKSSGCSDGAVASLDLLLRGAIQHRGPCPKKLIVIGMELLCSWSSALLPNEILVSE